MRLVVFGCSLTTGFGLDDNPDGKIISVHSWPTLLASHLDYDVDNQALNGASNKEILWRIQNYDFQPDDVVVVLWSHKDRWCLVREDGVKRINYWQDDTASISFFDYCHDDYDMTIDMHNRIQYAYMHLNHKGIANYHAYADKKLYERNYTWFDVPMLAVDMGHLRSIYPKAKYDHHPGLGAHDAFATGVYYNQLMEDLNG